MNDKVLAILEKRIEMFLKIAQVVAKILIYNQFFANRVWGYTVTDIPVHNTASVLHCDIA